MNEIALPIQIALLLASVAIVIFVVVSIPAILHLRRQADLMARELTELKAELSRLVLNITNLSARANRQCDEVEQVLQTVRGWTDRVDRVVEAVGDVVEPPILRLARNAHIYRAGIAKFFETFLHNNHNQPKKVESQHVR